MAAGRDYSDATPVRGYVTFAAPPATGIRGDPPVVQVSIVRIASSSDPLGFTPDDETDEGDGSQPAKRRAATP